MQNALSLTPAHQNHPFPQLSGEDNNPGFPRASWEFYQAFAQNMLNHGHVITLMPPSMVEPHLSPASAKDPLTKEYFSQFCCIDASNWTQHQLKVFSEFPSAGRDGLLLVGLNIDAPQDTAIDLAGTALLDATFTGSLQLTMTDAILVNSRFQTLSVLPGSTFNNAIFTGKMQDITLAPGLDCTGLTLRGVTLSNSLINADMSHGQILDSQISNVAFGAGTRLDNAQIENTQFHNCDLTGVSIKNATLISVDINDSKLPLSLLGDSGPQHTENVKVENLLTASAFMEAEPNESCITALNNRISQAITLSESGQLSKPEARLTLYLGQDPSDLMPGFDTISFELFSENTSTEWCLLKQPPTETTTRYVLIQGKTAAGLIESDKHPYRLSQGQDALSRNLHRLNEDDIARGIKALSVLETLLATDQPGTTRSVRNLESR